MGASNGLLEALPGYRLLREQRDEAQLEVQQQRQAVSAARLRESEALGLLRRCEEKLDGIYAERKLRRTVHTATFLVLVLLAILAATYTYGHQVGQDDARLQAGTSLDSPVDVPNLLTTPREYSWEGVEGADGYRVAFYPDSGDSPFVQDVNSNMLSYDLPPGTYRWYVWPLRNGVPDPQATTASEVTVP